MKPTWLKFWAEYPDYGTYPNSAAVKKDIGHSYEPRIKLQRHANPCQFCRAVGQRQRRQALRPT